MLCSVSKLQTVYGNCKGMPQYIARHYIEDMYR